MVNLILTIIIKLILMTVKGGSRPACAACRFQRRRCSSDCPLAPYFPANQPKIFQNVHRLYGVGNIMKILNQLKDNEQKQEAMKSIKYESYIRQIYRKDGCYGTIVYLQQQLVKSTRELQYVRLLLDAYKKNCGPMQDSLVFSSSQLGSYPIVNDQNLGGSSDWKSEGMTPMFSEGNDLGFYYDGSSDHGTANEVVRRVMALQPYDWDDQEKTSIDSIRIRSHLDEPPFCSSMEQGEGSPNYTEITCGLLDDQQSYMGSKLEAYELSSESLRDTEPGVSKAKEGLFKVQQGVHRLTMEF